MQGLYGQGGDSALDSSRMEMLKQIAAALAAQFGPSCEVVIHDLAAQDPERYSETAQRLQIKAQRAAQRREQAGKKRQGGRRPVKKHGKG